MAFVLRASIANRESRQKAAEILRIDRKTLYRKLKKLGLV
ncbi:MAG: hypothetical protein GY845_09870 [Planctomycetes bacterium]|nr:hypothetical protein [Planctomycetota bacterium]